MANSPTEEELELIFGDMRIEIIADIRNLRTEKSLMEFLDKQFEQTRLKNLGSYSRNYLKDKAADSRENLIIQSKQKISKERIVYRTSSNVPWNSSQIDFLRRYYSNRDIPVKSIAKRLGKTKKSVYTKAERLKLTRR